MQQTASRVSLIEKVPTNDRFLEKKLKSIVYDDRRDHLKKMMEQQQEDFIQKGIIVMYYVNLALVSYRIISAGIINK